VESITVSRRGAERITSGHPWVYASDVSNRANAQPGDAVRVADPRGRFLGIAHYSSTSQIPIRVLSREAGTLDRAFYLARLRSAIEYRSRIVHDSDACRLVFSEADLLPGLIIDNYAGYLSAQFLTQGMDHARPVILDCLSELCAPKGVLARNDAPSRRLEGLPAANEVVAGEIPDRVEIRMNGLVLQADLQHGQKTGIFLDQRENYAAAARWGRGKALDCFTSTGGFALHLARTCESVEGVDSSESALATAGANRDANHLSNVTFREADVFDYLAGCTYSRRKFDTVVLDPPAFAKSKATLDAALRGYKDINVRALKLLDPGGVLVTCSCSHHVSEADLLGVVAEAALNAGRTLRILERRAQAQDHPILLTVPETLYLKCVILEVL
jgi:23S rRNA (cytosine1962-C5)-methyltransferase